jgi:hypothetical protein
MCGAVTALAFVVPRFVPTGEGGLASAATAVLVFLGVLLVALALAVHLLVVTIRAYRDLPLLTRVAGIGPGVVLVLALALLVGFLRY